MEETGLYIILGLSAMGNLLQWFFVDNLLNQNKQLEDAVNKSLKANDKINEDVEKYHKVLQGIFTEAYSEMIKVDKKGSFSSDDEVGWSFRLIHDTINDITEKLNNLKRDNVEKEE